MAVGTFDAGIYTSADSGATWVSNAVPSEQWVSVNCSANGSKLVAAPYDRPVIFTSTNSGVTWTSNSTPVNVWTAIASSADGNKLVALVQDRNGAIYTSRDFGVTWVSNSAPYKSWESVVSSADGGKLVAAVYGGGIYASQSVSAPLLRLVSSGSHAIISWIIPSMDLVLQQNTDLSTTGWADVPTTPTVAGYENHLMLSPTNGSLFYRLRSR